MGIVIEIHSCFFKAGALAVNIMSYHTLSLSERSSSKSWQSHGKVMAKSWECPSYFQLSMSCSFPNKKYKIFIRLSIYKPCVQWVSHTNSQFFFLRMNQPPQVSSLSALFTQSAQSYHNAVRWSGRRQAIANQNKSSVFPKAPIQASHARNVSKNRSLSLPIIPFEKVQHRASASLLADTKAHPRLCASQRSFGTP